MRCARDFDDVRAKVHGLKNILFTVHCSLFIVPARRVRRGAALLEVVIALTVFAIAGTAMVTLTAETLTAVRRAREADTELRQVNALLGAVALWTRDDLDRHLGGRTQGRWRMRVDRPGTSLYVVVLSDSTDTREILRTSLFRPELANASR